MCLIKRFLRSCSSTFRMIMLLILRKIWFFFESIYNLFMFELKTLREYLNENLINDFIVFFSSSIEFFILFVKKKNDSLRLCVNYCDEYFIRFYIRGRRDINRRYRELALSRARVIETSHRIEKWWNFREMMKKFRSDNCLFCDKQSISCSTFKALRVFCILSLKYSLIFHSFFLFFFSL